MKHKLVIKVPEEHFIVLDSEQLPLIDSIQVVRKERYLATKHYLAPREDLELYLVHEDDLPEGKTQELLNEIQSLKEVLSRQQIQNNNEKL